jgi:hypothetical protein
VIFADAGNSRARRAALQVKRKARACRLHDFSAAALPNDAPVNGTNPFKQEIPMRRFIPFLLLMAIVLPGCSHLGARNSASQGSTGAYQNGQAPAPQSPWANDPYFISPPA